MLVRLPSFAAAVSLAATVLAVSVAFLVVSAAGFSPAKYPFSVSSALNTEATSSWLEYTSQNCSFAVACSVFLIDSGFLTPASSTLMIPFSLSKEIVGCVAPNLSIRVSRTLYVLSVASPAAFLMYASTSSLELLLLIAVWFGLANKDASLPPGLTWL
ncbi:hypothetical protein D3C87_1471940 [compost metagenome]